jgi:hypothetical protein
MIPPLADVAERRDYGKSRRQILNRVDQCHWKPPRIRRDPVELLVDANRDRLPELLPIKRSTTLEQSGQHGESLREHWGRAGCVFDERTVEGLGSYPRTSFPE